MDDYREAYWQSVFLSRKRSAISDAKTTVGGMKFRAQAILLAITAKVFKQTKRRYIRRCRGTYARSLLTKVCASRSIMGRNAGSLDTEKLGAHSLRKILDAAFRPKSAT
jgi:hypothetical protein